MKSRLRALLSGSLPSGGVAEQVIKSGMWVMSMNVSDRVLQIILLVVLSNLLSPAEFGLFGVALLGLGALNRLSNLGLNEALIYEKEENVDVYLDTALGLRVARGLIIAALLFLAAPLIADLLGEPGAVDVVRAIGLSPLLVGLHNPGVVYFRKDLDFHKEFLYRVSGSVLRFVVGIALAVALQNVWALVLSYLAADVGQLIASYAAHDYRPGLSLSRKRAREMVTYGKWITGGSIVYFLYSEGDDAIVAGLLGSAALGYYQLAYRLSNAPGTEVSEVVRSVSFPAFSKLQDDMEALRSGFFQTLRLTTLISFPMAVGIAAVAPVFVRAFMGSEWTPIIPVMQILAGYGLLLSVTSSYGSVWKAQGRPDIGPKLGAVRVVIMAVTIVPVTLEYGVVGTAALVVGIFAFPMFQLDTYLLVKSLETTWWRVLRELAYPAAASAAMGAVVVYADRTLAVGPAPLEFFVLVGLGGVSYAAAVGVLESLFGWGLQQEVRAISDAILG